VRNGGRKLKDLRTHWLVFKSLDERQGAMN